MALTIVETKSKQEIKRENLDMIDRFSEEKEAILQSFSDDDWRTRRLKNKQEKKTRETETQLWNRDSDFTRNVG